MWSVPFNFNLHDSYFAVGMIFNRGRFASSSYWFNQVGHCEVRRGGGEGWVVVPFPTSEPDQTVTSTSRTLWSIREVMLPARE